MKKIVKRRRYNEERRSGKKGRRHETSTMLRLSYKPWNVFVVLQCDD